VLGNNGSDAIAIDHTGFYNATTGRNFDGSVNADNKYWYAAAGSSCISTCQNLNQSNRAYSLCNNVSISGATCFNVTAANVSLDCKGYSITGNNSDNTYGIYSANNFTTIRNCKVSRFDYEIYFNGTNNGTIQNVTTNSNATAGHHSIYLFLSSNNTLSSIFASSDHSTGIAIINSSYNYISNGTAFSGANMAGIWISKSNFNTISNFTIISGASSGSGLNLGSSSNNILKNLNVSCNGHVVLISNSFNNTFADSSITSTSSSPVLANGLNLDSSSSNTFTNLTINSNAGRGITLDSSSDNNIINSSTSTANNSIYILGSNNTISNSAISAIQGNGIAIGSASNYNKIFNNQISSTNGTGVYIFPNAVANVFYLNNFTATGDKYVFDTSSSLNYFNATVDGKNQGNMYANVLDGTIGVSGAVLSSIPNIYIGTNGAGVPYNNSTSGGKFYSVVGAADYAPLTPSSIANLILGSSAGGIVTGSAYNVTVPATLPISATPNSGYTFASWSSVGNCSIASATAATTNVTMRVGGCNVTGTFSAISNPPGGGGGGGGSGSGGGSSSQTISATVKVEICSGVVCEVRVTRKISSSDAISTLTTTLKNMNGSECAMEDFVFSDTIPSAFASVDELSFSTQYVARNGQTVKFLFPSFQSDESKTITYSASRWIPTSRANNFSTPSISAKMCPPVLPAQNTTNVTKNETKPPVIVKNTTKPAAPAQVQPSVAPPNDGNVPLAASLFGFEFGEVAPYLCIIGILVLLLLLALFIRKQCNRKQCKANNWPWAKVCRKCGAPFNKK